LNRPGVSRTELVFLTAFAAAVRAVWAFWPGPFVGDAVEYWQLATMVATHGRYSYDGVVSSTSRPPLYSALIAALMRLTNHPHAALLAVQIVLGSLTVTLAASLASRVFDRRVGLLAGAALAVAPMSAHFTAVVLSETLFTFFVVLSMWCWQMERPNASGIALGLAALTRPVAQPFALLLGICGLVFWKRVRQRHLLRIAALAWLTMTPWMIRNVVETGTATVSDGNWANTLAYGTVRLHTGENRDTQVARALHFDQSKHAWDAATPESSETSVLRFTVDRILADPVAWIRARVSQYPWLLIDGGDYLPTRVVATPFFRALSERRFLPILLKLSFLGSNVLVVALSAYGAWSSRRRALDLLPLWSLPAFVLAAEIPTWVEPRFVLPIVPFIIIFAAVGMMQLVARDAVNG
jgi:4-amino-4-deoxy-L-arabinose transferase-like glycosyltransferase